jgi:hypothetical protein
MQAPEPERAVHAQRGVLYFVDMQLDVRGFRGRSARGEVHVFRSGASVERAWGRCSWDEYFVRMLGAVWMLGVT